MRRALALLAGLVAGITLAAPAALASPAVPPVRAAPGGQHGPAPSPGGRVGSFGVRLVDIPRSEAADRRAWRYIIDFLHPGAVIRRRIQVENESSRAARVRVYADAARIGQGVFTGDKGQTPDELTRWTSVSHPVLRLGPWASAMDLVTIRVPRSASRGERYGVIWAQETSRVRSARRFTVMEVNRVGVRVYLDVGPGGAPPVDFAITSVTGERESTDSPDVAVRVRNTGQRAVDLGGNLKLYDGPGGASAGPIRFQSGLTLAAGQSGVLRAALGSDIPDGSWHVLVTLQSDLTRRQARGSIDLNHHEATGIAVTPAGLAAGSFLVVVLISAGWFLGRRLRWRSGPHRA